MLQKERERGRGEFVVNNCKSYFLKETEKRKDFFWLVNDGKVFLGKRERERERAKKMYMIIFYF